MVRFAYMFGMCAGTYDYCTVASWTVQPDGIPLVPVVQLDIDAALTNVPVDETPFTQSSV